MKINFLLPHLRISGGVRIALMYADKLAGRGHNVTVYVRSANPFRRAVANLLHLGYPHWMPRLKARIIRVPIFSPTYIADADAIIATTCQSAVALEEFPPEKGRAYYLVQHDEGLYHAPREVADRALAGATRKIVVSSWLKEILYKRFNQGSELLLNPVDTKQFKKIPRTADPKTIRVLLLHHTYHWKGTAEGAAAVQAVKKRHPEVRLVLFGVRKKEDVSIPNDEYHFDVPQDKLAELYSNADIYLCPSWYEGYGLPSVEAMHCGAALVTYDNGGSRDYAIDGKTALVARHRDVDDLARQLERMVSDAALRTRIASDGQKFVRGMPGWEERTGELENMIGHH